MCGIVMTALKQLTQSCSAAMGVLAGVCMPPPLCRCVLMPTMSPPHAEFACYVHIHHGSVSGQRQHEWNTGIFCTSVLYVFGNLYCGNHTCSTYSVSLWYEYQLLLSVCSDIGIQSARVCVCMWCVCTFTCVIHVYVYNSLPL